MEINNVKSEVSNKNLEIENFQEPQQPKGTLHKGNPIVAHYVHKVRASERKLFPKLLFGLLSQSCSKLRFNRLYNPKIGYNRLLRFNQVSDRVCVLVWSCPINCPINCASLQVSVNLPSFHVKAISISKSNTSQLFTILHYRPISSLLRFNIMFLHSYF